jgi:DMSO/TMAO reductase YedYZ heme-binding membrane subunit
MSEIELTRLSGHVALTCLLLSLCRIKARAFGLAAALFGAAHALYTVSSPLIEDVTHLYYEPHLRAGASVLFILLILAATSFPRVFRIPEWKLLHRLAYAAGLLAVHHVWLSSHATGAAIIAPAAVVGLALAARACYPRRRAVRTGTLDT